MGDAWRLLLSALALAVCAGLPEAAKDHLQMEVLQKVRSPEQHAPQPPTSCKQCTNLVCVLACHAAATGVQTPHVCARVPTMYVM